MKLLKILFLLTGLILFALILREVDLNALLQQIQQIGLVGLIIVLSLYAVAFLIDSLGWQIVHTPLSFSLSWLKRFFLVRLAGQAFNHITPLASLGGEPIKAMMMKNHYQIPYRESGVSLLITKTSDMLGLVMFLSVGFLALWQTDQLGAGYKTLAAVGLSGLSLSILGFFLMQRLRITSLTTSKLSQTPFGKKLIDVHHHIHEFDDKLVHFYTQHRARFFISLGLACLNWTLGMIEIYIVFQLLGHPVSLMDALIIESLAQLVRAGTFFIPASLGAQEGAFFLVCQAITGNPTHGVAVAMIRRLREIIWISLGLLTYWLYSLQPSALATAEE